MKVPITGASTTHRIAPPRRWFGVPVWAVRVGAVVGALVGAVIGVAACEPAQAPAAAHPSQTTPSAQAIPDEPAPPPPSAPPSAQPAPPAIQVPPLGPVVTEDDGSATLALHGTPRPLAVDPALQGPLSLMLAAGRPQYGGIVMLDVKTGRVLAVADHSSRDKTQAAAALRPVAKAASVFKTVTVSALLRQGVSERSIICTTGGQTRLRLSDFVDDPRRERRCVRLQDALPWSQNTAVAKLAGAHLTPELLAKEAEAFGLVVPRADSNTPSMVPAAVPDVMPSFAVIPDDDLATFATTSAGFGDVRLSALGAARLMRMVARGGVDGPVQLFADDDEVDGAPAWERRVMSEEQAEQLQSMLLATTTRGTATRLLHGAGVRPPRELRGLPWKVGTVVAGKTGSLTDRDVSLDTSWFAGYFPATDPQVAFAVVIVNDEWLWYVRALEVARAALATTLAVRPELASRSVAAR